ncbi:tetratricopeptide repeat protein [Thalassotalea sp. G2M2-11]|uniref:tetratricopeptide repeat protein n=1 Tax=Thalassotalea sp. G2M2-11 TaxID=2787627 RepID=UPI0019D02F49|nr:tetratricopeptide repeat protein [Thalassotalea sp. G2M2-11]
MNNRQRGLILTLLSLVFLIFYYFVYLPNHSENNTNAAVQNKSVLQQKATINTTKVKKPPLQTENAQPAENKEENNGTKIEKTEFNDMISCEPSSILDEKTVLNLESQLLKQLDITLPNEQLMSILLSDKAKRYDESGQQKAEAKRLKDHQEYTDSLFNFYQQYPDNTIAYSHLLSACLQNNYRYCDDSLFKQITAFDDNGELWLKLAMILLKQGEIEQANNVLLHASQADKFTGYYHEQIALFYQTASKYFLTSTDNANLIWLSFNLDSFTSGFLGPVNYCRSAEVNSVLAETCFELGQQMKNNSQSMLGTMVGIGLMKTYYEKHNFKELALEVIKEKPFNKESRSRFNQASNVMFFDPSLFIQWLDSGLNYGEAKANQQLIDEVIWRSKDPNYQPCPNIQNQ